MGMFGKIVAIALAIIAFVFVYMIGVPQLISSQNDLLVLLGLTTLLVGGISVLAFAFTMIKKGFQPVKKEDSNG